MWREDAPRRESTLPAHRGDERERWSLSVDFIATKLDARHVINTTKDNLERIRSEKRPLRIMSWSEFSMGSDYAPSDLEDFKEPLPEGTNGKEPTAEELEAYYERAAKHLYRAAKIRLRRQIEATMLLGRQSGGGQGARLGEAKLMLEQQREKRSPEDVKSDFLEKQSLRISHLEAENRRLTRENLYLSTKHDQRAVQRARPNVQQDRPPQVAAPTVARSADLHQTGPSRNQEVQPQAQAPRREQKGKEAAPTAPADDESEESGDSDASDDFEIVSTTIGTAQESNASELASGIKIRPGNPFIASGLAHIDVTAAQRRAHAEVVAARAAGAESFQAAASTSVKPAQASSSHSRLDPAAKPKKRARAPSDGEGESSKVRIRHEEPDAADSDSEDARREYKKFKQFVKLENERKKRKSEPTPPPPPSSSSSSSSSGGSSDEDSDSDVQMVPRPKVQEVSGSAKSSAVPMVDAGKSTQWTGAELEVLRKACTKVATVQNWRSCLLLLQHKLSKRGVERTRSAITAKVRQLGLLSDVVPSGAPQDAVASGSKAAKRGDSRKEMR